MSAVDNFANSQDFDQPLYNVWKQQSKSNKVDHFGNSEPKWLENLLYLYTEPADIVVAIAFCPGVASRFWLLERWTASFGSMSVTMTGGMTPAMRAGKN